MSLVKDKDVIAVTVMADVDGEEEEEEFEDGWDAIQNDYLIIIYNYCNFRFLTGQPLQG